MNTLACSLPPCRSPPSLRYPAPASPLALPHSRRMVRRLPGVVAHASRGDDASYGAESGGRLVDEDMVVLRKRLHEMQAAETNYEPPTHWAEWEKRYYARYDGDICWFVGVLQAFLMSTRPSVAIGLLALVALSIPTSAAVVGLNLVGAVKAVLAGLHLS